MPGSAQTHIELCILIMRKGFIIAACVNKQRQIEAGVMTMIDEHRSASASVS